MAGNVELPMRPSMADLGFFLQKSEIQFLAANSKVQHELNESKSSSGIYMVKLNLQVGR